MRYLLVIYRLLFFALYTARIVAEVYWRRVWLRSDTARVMAVRRRWAIRVLDGVGIRTTVEGAPPDYPCLLLANHRSYLDPILLLRDLYAYPVAKAELAKWPLIGKGARWAGILYVQRERGGSRVSTLKAIADVVQVEHFSVILFPEGTTSGLPGMLPLKKGACRAAAKWGLPVVPVAICFEDSRDFWVGNESFFQHAWKRFQCPKIKVRVCYGPVLQGADSDALEYEVRSWIEQKLLGTSAGGHQEFF
ncbi:MAG: 1-acyl-sn-glycerol-3-phosphate acyltransferase [Lewinellaceae bacterium]|nr:1-acyl-sn-glycerol-3-phosphate acyltransferase [Lewinellaceae bacterium]